MSKTSLRNIPIHLFSLLDDLLAVTVRSSAFLLGLLRGGRIVFLDFVVLVGLLDAHLAINTRHAQAEVRVIKHADGQLNGFRAKVDYNS
jgi:hypothetical protein